MTQEEREHRHEVISKAVGQMSTDILAEVNILRSQLDECEKVILENAARVTENLKSHVELCGRVRNEVTRIASIVQEIRISHEAQAEGEPA